MKKLVLFVFVSLTLTLGISAQATTAGQTASSQTSADEKPKKVIFRPTKDQIMQVQKILIDKKLYSGEASGKYNEETRTGIKGFQKDNGLKQTGTLNRATLEKFGVELTDTQKAIPVSPNSFETPSADGTAEKKATPEKTTQAATSAKEDTPKKTKIFRATKDQVMAAQKMLKSKGMYSGEETGKLDDATRDGLKKFQDANGLKITGTLNQVTLEKMGIELTDKQKADAAESNK